MVIVSLYLNSIHKLFREWNFADGICLFLGFISMVVSDGLQGQNETLIYFKTTDRAHITKKLFGQCCAWRGGEHFCWPTEALAEALLNEECSF